MVVGACCSENQIQIPVLSFCYSQADEFMKDKTLRNSWAPMTRPPLSRLEDLVEDSSTSLIEVTEVVNLCSGKANRFFEIHPGMLKTLNIGWMLFIFNKGNSRMCRLYLGCMLFMRVLLYSHSMGKFFNKVMEATSGLLNQVIFCSNLL